MIGFLFLSFKIHFSKLICINQIALEKSIQLLLVVLLGKEKIFQKIGQGVFSGSFIELMKVKRQAIIKRF